MPARKLSLRDRDILVRGINAFGAVLECLDGVVSEQGFEGIARFTKDTESLFGRAATSYEELVALAQHEGAESEDEPRKRARR